MPLVTVATYREPIDAELTRMRLEAAGYPAFVFDHNLIGIDWRYSQAVGGAKVKVLQRDLASARETLAEDRGADLEQELAPRFPGPEAGCPACGAIGARRSHVQRNLAALCILTGLPLLFFWRRDVCRACGHSWRRPRATDAVPEETLAADALVHERHRHRVVQVLLALLAVLSLLHHFRASSL